MPSNVDLVKNDSKNMKEKISICDLAQTNTSDIIQKMEFQVPVLLQCYADLFTKNLHSFNTTFGTCRISEKQFFDKMGIDHHIMEEMAEFWNFGKNLTLIQIETYSKFVQDYTAFRVATIESFEKSMNSMMNYYSKSLEILHRN